jgi:hypothetical protein
VAATFTGKVTHVLSTLAEVASKTTKIILAQGRQVPIVSESFLLACEQAGGDPGFAGHEIGGGGGGGGEGAVVVAAAAKQDTVTTAATTAAITATFNTAAVKKKEPAAVKKEPVPAAAAVKTDPPPPPAEMAPATSPRRKSASSRTKSATPPPRKRRSSYGKRYFSRVSVRNGPANGGSEAKEEESTKKYRCERAQVPGRLVQGSSERTVPAFEQLENMLSVIVSSSPRKWIASGQGLQHCLKSVPKETVANKSLLKRLKMGLRVLKWMLYVHYLVHGATVENAFSPHDFGGNFRNCCTNVGKVPLKTGLHLLFVGKTVIYNFCQQFERGKKKAVGNDRFNGRDSFNWTLFPMLLLLRDTLSRSMEWRTKSAALLKLSQPTHIAPQDFCARATVLLEEIRLKKKGPQAPTALHVFQISEADYLASEEHRLTRTWARCETAEEDHHRDGDGVSSRTKKKTKTKLEVGQLYWAQFGSYPHWPAQLLSLTRHTHDGDSTA